MCNGVLLVLVLVLVLAPLDAAAGRGRALPRKPSHRSLALPPLIPFSPLCLVDPTLPQCADYINGLGPADCAGVSTQCERGLFRLNHTLARGLFFADFVARNLDCAEEGFEPCWEGATYNASRNPLAGPGRLAQGSCSVHCRKNITEYEAVCVRNGGFLCDSEYNLGMDGTEVKVTLPTCLPVQCQATVAQKRASGNDGDNTTSDLVAIQACMQRHTCESSTELRRLVPECKVRLTCLDEQEAADLAVTLVLAAVGALAAAALVLKAGAFSCCCREKRSRNLEEQEELNFFVGTSHDNSLGAPLLDPAQQNIQGHHTSSRFVLSKDLADQQSSGRFALGRREGEPAAANLAMATAGATAAGVDAGFNTVDASDATANHHAHYMPGTALTYRNLFFRHRGQLILRGVSGIVRRGTCVAVIGAPDSGATTLLRCLAGRQPTGRVEGSILVDGRPPDRKIRRIVAFVPKEDVNIALMTVRETLEFSARCRLPRTVSAKVRGQRVQAWLQLLGLRHVSDVIVGDAVTRGISGGERRRVSIGVEAVAGHRLVIADSPTNGLDSEAAFNVIKTMRALADAGHNGFMASVRQPSTELLSLFDTVCLMSRGTCIFWGSINDALPFLAGLGFEKPPAKSVPDFLEEMTGNPGQFFVDVFEEKPLADVEEGQGEAPFAAAEASGGGEAKTAPRSHRRLLRRLSIVDVHQCYVKSKHFERLGREMWRQIDAAASLEWLGDSAGNNDAGRPRSFLNCCPNAVLDEDGKCLCWGEKYATGLLSQIVHVTVRQVTLVSRSPTVRARMGRAAFQGVLLGTMFFHFDQSQNSAQNRFGALFISISAIVMGSVATIPELFSQRRVFYQQKNAGYFSPLAWQVSLFLTEIPITLIEMAMYSLLLYGLCGLRGGIFSYAFLFFYASMVLANLICFSVAAMSVMLVDSVIAAQALVPVYNAMNILFSGYLMTEADIPLYLRWLTKTSTIARLFAAISINEMDGQVFHCEDAELIPFRGNPRLNIPAPQGFNNENYRACPLQTGDDALRYLYGIAPGQDVWGLFFFSMVFLGFFQLLLFVSILYVDHSRTTSDDPVVSSGGTSKKNMMKPPPPRPKKKKKKKTNMTGPTAASAPSSLSSTPSASSSGTPISFEKLCYTVTLPNGKDRQLLTDVTGFAQPGELVALMGPSGAGKTTLLDVLAARKTGGVITGSILLDGLPVDNKFARYTGYCEQMDSHLPTLTVREAVAVSAALRLPPSVDGEERDRKIDRVLKQLLLDQYCDQLLGTPGLPGAVAPEIRKLVTIGVELVCDPAVLFMDEPTTGLDSSSALATMTLAKQIAEGGRRGDNTIEYPKIAVICTIHQPAREIFSLFHNLFLLQKGGRVAYFGPVKDMENYFVETCQNPACELEQNPADYALACAAAVSFDGDTTAADLHDRSEWKRAQDAHLPERRSQRDPSRAAFASPYATSSLHQFNTLLRVYSLRHWRDKKVLWTRMSLAVVFGLIVGVLYYGIGTDQTGAKSRVGVVFISLVYAGNVANMAIPSNVMLRPIVFRERGSHAYRLCPFYWATLIAELPFVTLQGSLFVVTFYFLVGFRASVVHFMLYLFGFIILSMTTFSFSHLMASVAPNADVGTILSATVQSVFTLFCGFMLPYESIPVYWRPLYYLSMFRYPLGFFVSNEMRGLEFQCPVGDGPAGRSLPVGAFPVFVGGTANNVSFPPPPFGNGAYAPGCAPLFGNFTDLRDPRCWRFFCPISDGEFILDRYSMPTSTDGMLQQLLVMVGFFLGLRVLTFVALKNIQHITR
jgi:ATP-binding cassette subfamily G (WHITE) protein 2 (SNQ2)